MAENKRKSEKGQSLVELGLSLVFLLYLVSGTIDLGRAFFTFITLRDATQEGALYGSYCPLETDHIVNRVKNSATGPMLNSSMIQISTSDITYSPDSFPGSAINVHAKVNFEITTPFIGAIVGGHSFPIQTTITDTILRNPPAGACEE